MLRPDLPALIAITTPALVVDQIALDANIARMAEVARRQGVKLRPHAKTHKSAFIAGKQLAAGAVGIACATILEAEALAAAGVTGLLITSPIVGADKIARLVRLNRARPLAVVVDHPSQVEALAAALAFGEPPLEILVDVDIGQGRTGVANGQDGVALARMVADQPQLAFRGLQGYAGQTYFFLAPLFIPLFILGVPILDTLFAIVRRATRRQGVATADMRHLHHRLIEMGHGQRRSVVILWAWTALLSAFVLYPVLTQSFVSYVPIGAAMLGLLLYTLFHPQIRRNRAT